jgi:hypothetical protein
MSALMSERRQHRSSLTILALPLLALAACGGSGGSAGGPTAPDSAPMLARAAVMINGQTVNGMTMSRSQSPGGGTRFEAMLQMDGHSVVGGSMRVRHQGPGMGMSTAEFMLLDNGTHGDMMAGDGLYTYDDMREDYGCDARDTPMGEHHYDFMGTDAQGHQSNSIRVTVTISQ